MENNNQDPQEGELHLDETKLEESTAATGEVAVENELSQEEKLIGEVAELKEKYLRLYSDFENFRKRTAKERIDLIKTASEDVLKDLIPVVDDFERAIPISARTGDGIPGLKAALEHELFEGMSSVVVRVPYRVGRLISRFHEQGVVEKIEHEKESVLIEGRLPNRLLS